MKKEDTFTVSFDRRGNALVKFDDEYIALLEAGRLKSVTGTCIIYAKEEEDSKQTLTRTRDAEYGRRRKAIIVKDTEVFGELILGSINLSVSYSDKEGPKNA